MCIFRLPIKFVSNVFFQLLETMVKNCGDYVHFQIAERNILQEMAKIVKKKVDLLAVA